MKLFLGLDGGQSSTIAVVGDETGRIIGMGQDGPCNHVKSAEEGREKFVSVIGGCIAKALANLDREGARFTFEAACLGFSGGPADKKAILEEMLSVKKLMVTTDALIALTAAHAGGPGCITIAGTGNIAFARNAEGKVRRAGGWGYIFGDEGAGFDLTRQALRAALRQHVISYRQQLGAAPQHVGAGEQHEATGRQQVIAGAVQQLGAGAHTGCGQQTATWIFFSTILQTQTWTSRSTL